MDTGVFPSSSGEGDVSRHEVALAGGRSIDALIRAGDKGEAIRTMMNGAAALTRRLYDEGRIHGVLSIGGAQGTIMGTTAMRALPLGVPKIMLSTMASGKRPFETLCRYRRCHPHAFGGGFLRIEFRPAADAQQRRRCARRHVAGRRLVAAADRPQVAITIYGTTTPAGMRLVSLLQERGYEAVAFHPNGVGGRAMEEMIAQGRFQGVIDLTTHELIDELAGGQHAAGPNRLEAATRMGVPQVVVPGSTDYIVTGRFSDLKKSFRQRTTMMHNPEMTFVMPSEAEMGKLGQIMARKLNPGAGKGKTVVMVPLKGFCFPNYEGRPLYNPKRSEGVCGGAGKAASSLRSRCACFRCTSTTTPSPTPFSKSSTH